ncbi:uncharacterized protein LOC106708522 [Papilio machaon]|uniref:uncharacterized protein LOC106708522 n=1 Tax=Papilio machaon TaxID=76193 RepID=UPI001E665991|nr:uncharacterized protein LOC106708522 [Papilio machaon]
MMGSRFRFILTIFFVSTYLVQKGSSQNVVAVKVQNLFKMQHGLGWPHTLRVAQGNEALLKLDRTLEQQNSCEITPPSGLTFNINSPPSTRYTKWTDGCGVRVRNVTMNDEGRWRLTANGSNKLTGWTELFVEESKTSYSASPISLQDGQTEAKIELTTLENSYCLVKKPFAESSLVPGQCSVTLDRTTRAIQGVWNVQLGLPGQIVELELQRQITVETERLDVGYVTDKIENKMHLYCNILHTSKNITFCRFQKSSENIGYNVVDGLSDGRHSYYGEGFAKKHCGITIEKPTAKDYGTWRCSVGVQMWEGTTIRSQPPMQALVSVAPDTRSSRIARELQNSEMEDIRTIFVQKNMTFTIMCRASISLSYCWFQHPNGTQYTPGRLETDDQLFWYTGENLQVGDCGISFAHVTSEDAGKWTCHMGPREQLGVEIIDSVFLRVTGPLAANKKEVVANIGGSATLFCHTANGNRPLEYCRFLSPTFVGIRVDQSVSESSAILNRYYFTPNRSLDYGDCSLTINPVYEEDIGEWTCAALINEEILESRDHITVYASVASAPQFTAGIVGMSVGVVLLLVALAGVLWYRRYRPTFPWSRTRAPSSMNNFSMNTRTSNASSLESDRSN